MRRNAEDAIDQVLAGIREASAPDGIEQRVLAAMQDHKAANSERRWIWAYACAGAVVVSVAVYLMLPKRTLHEVTAHSPATTTQPQQPVADLPRTRKSADQAISVKHEAGPSMPIDTTAKPPEVMTAVDALALEEMRADSMPAPEMPLTEQERLLKRMAHKPNPDEFSELNPVERDALYAAAKAELHTIFELPTMNEPE